jgi:anti-sigma B factor antagonist
VNFDINTEDLGSDAYVIEVIGKGAKDVVVDFSDTTFIDSTTLGVLVGGVKRLRPNGGQLRLVCSDRNITKIFEITGLNKVFPIHASRAEAVENLGESAPQA